MDATFIIGLIMGALASWAISHWYYRRSSNDQERLFRKLSSEVRTAILDDSRSNLSIPELNRLLEDKTIDPEATGYPLPFKACPKCGSVKLERHEYIDQKHDELYYVIQCKECPWNDWTQ